MQAQLGRDWGHEQGSAIQPCIYTHPSKVELELPESSSIRRWQDSLCCLTCLYPSGSLSGSASPGRRSYSAGLGGGRGGGGGAGSGRRIGRGGTTHMTSNTFWHMAAMCGCASSAQLMQLCSSTQLSWLAAMQKDAVARRCLTQLQLLHRPAGTWTLACLLRRPHASNPSLVQCCPNAIKDSCMCVLTPWTSHACRHLVTAPPHQVLPPHQMLFVAGGADWQQCSKTEFGSRECLQEQLAGI